MGLGSKKPGIKAQQEGESEYEEYNIFKACI